MITGDAILETDLPWISTGNDSNNLQCKLFNASLDLKYDFFLLPVQYEARSIVVKTHNQRQYNGIATACVFIVPVGSKRSCILTCSKDSNIARFTGCTCSNDPRVQWTQR